MVVKSITIFWTDIYGISRLEFLLARSQSANSDTDFTLTEEIGKNSFGQKSYTFHFSEKYPFIGFWGTEANALLKGLSSIGIV